MKFLAELDLGGEVWVFSDDPASAASTLRFLEGSRVRWISDYSDRLSPEEELILMTFGKAHIIANSTFSWWGAFLSESSMQVIAPEEWFESREEPLDLIPPNWTRIKSYWEKR
jgi:hypothetical protein